jgi:hypothetical protein
LDEISGYHAEILCKSMYRRVILSTPFFENPYREANRRKYQKMKYFSYGFPWMKFQDIMLKYCVKIFIEQLYYQHIFFRILTGKPIEENTKR